MPDGSTYAGSEKVSQEWNVKDLMCESYGMAMDSVNGEGVEVVGHEKEMMNDQNVFLYKPCYTCCLSQHQLQYTSYH